MQRKGFFVEKTRDRFTFKVGLCNFTKDNTTRGSGAKGYFDEVAWGEVEIARVSQNTGAGAEKFDWYHLVERHKSIIA